MKRSFLFLLATLGMITAHNVHDSLAYADIPPPGAEFPVVWWAQNHVREALLLYKSTNAQSLEKACKSGHLNGSEKTKTAWRSFSEKDRIIFCQKYPGQTHYIFRQAPYFMVSPPGSHK